MDVTYESTVTDRSGNVVDMSWERLPTMCRSLYLLSKKWRVIKSWGQGARSCKLYFRMLNHGAVEEGLGRQDERQESC